MAQEVQDVPSILKGKRVVGGGINLSINDNTFNSGPDVVQDIDATTFSFRPYAGKFIQDKILLGGQFEVSFGNIENVTDQFGNIISTDRESFGIGFGVFLRRYYPVIGKFGIFIQPSIDITFSERDDERSIFDVALGERISEEITESDIVSASASTSLGLYIFLGERFSLETNLGNVAFNYQTEDRSIMDISNNNQFSSDNEASSINFNLINEISFDRLFVVNFFF